MPEAAALLISGLVAAVFFGVIDPRGAPPLVLMLSFLVLLAVSYSAARLLGRALRLPKKMPEPRYNGLVLAAALIPVLLLALQSIGQLTIRDVITLALLVGVAYIYVVRMPGSR